MKPHETAYVTPEPWRNNLQHRIFATVETYQKAAEWLKDCATVADWGGGQGFFGTLLPASCRYTIVDGTVQSTEQVLADLATYRVESDGILIRHVLDGTPDWRAVLNNALASFRQRLVLVTYTKDAVQPVEPVKIKSGWPVQRFNPDFLRSLLQPYLVSDCRVRSSHPERVYYLERPCAS